MLRRPAASVFLVIALGAPLWAQHAGVTGGSSAGHTGGGFHAGGSPSRSFAPSAPRLAGNTSASHLPASQGQQPRRWPYGSPGRGVGYRTRSPYLYAGYPWLGFGYGLPFGYGQPYSNDVDDSGGYSVPPQAQPEGPQAEYGPEPPNGEVAAFRPPYQGPAEAAPVHAQPATTLIFKDGRPPVQVHNYALTATTLYALDGDTRQEISLSLLNLPATMQANRAAGVDFALPESH